MKLKIIFAAIAAVVAGGLSAEPFRVGAVNCGHFEFGSTGNKNGITLSSEQYAAQWQKLIDDNPAAFFVFGETGKTDFPKGSIGISGVDTRILTADGKGTIETVNLPKAMTVGGVTLVNGGSPRSFRVVKDFNGKKIAFYGLHLLAEGHVKDPRPWKERTGKREKPSYSQILRREHYKILIEDAKKYDYAVLAGDFNAQRPWEYDVFVEAGFKIGNCSEEFGTEATLRNIPADNIIVSPALALEDFRVAREYTLNSDHVPILALVDLRENVAPKTKKFAKKKIPTVVEYLALPITEREKWMRDRDFRKAVAGKYPDGEGVLSRWVRVEGIPNLRDVGGLATVDGRVMKRGLMYRSAGWNDNAKTYKDKPESEWVKGECRLTEKGREQAKALRLKTDLDLRGDAECWGMTGSPVGEEVRWVHISSGHYGEILKRPSYRDAVRKDFEVLADRSNYPLVFHCIGGADRTGCLAMMVEYICGVDEVTALKDWEITVCYTTWDKFYHENFIYKFLKDVHAQPGATPAEQMRAYLRKCGVTDEQMDSVRSIMLGD